MKPHDIDEETIAALLDNRLEETERQRVLAAIATSDELRELFVEAAAALHQPASTLSPEIHRPVPVPPSPQRAGRQPAAISGNGRREARHPYRGQPTRQAEASRPDAAPPARHAHRWATAWRVMAAAVVMAGGLYIATSGSFGPTATSLSPGYVASLGAAAGALPADWTDTGWPVTRSGGGGLTGTQAVPPEGSFRLGYRSIDLRVAVEGGRETDVREVVNDLRTQLRGVPGTNLLDATYGLVLDSYQGGAEAVSLEALLQDAEQMLQEIAERDADDLGHWAFELGRWTEGLRLAILADRRDLILDAEVIVVLAHLRSVEFDPATTAALESVAQQLDAFRESGDSTALAQAVRDLADTAAGR